MNLAILSPMPPQQSGIADYIVGILPGLVAEGYSIDLFTTAEKVDVDHCPGIKINGIASVNMDCLRSYDLIVYHLGNNANYHSHMLALLEKYGGIVHLHDLVLHHLIATVTYGMNEPLSYYARIERWYGPVVRELVERMISAGTPPWETEVVTDLPLFADCLQYADGCIVHSQYAQDQINTRFPDLSAYKIDQLYPTKPIHKRSVGKIIKLGIFGRVDPHKQVDLILKVLARLKKEKVVRNFYLYIVGSVDVNCSYLHALVDEYHLASNVKITGRVSEDEFNAFFSGIDILLALRFPTMGETSAVVMKALQLAIPIIVSDVGWYRELPSHVKKISVQKAEQELMDALLALLTDKQQLVDLQDRATIFRDNELDFSRSVKQYADALRIFYKQKTNTILHRQLAPILDGISCLDESAVYTPILKRLIDIFD